MRPRPPTVIAMGGGGFSMEPENPLLDEYVLTQTGVSRPAICFLPTASGDAEDYVTRFHKAFEALGARPSHLLLPWIPEPDGPPEAGRPGGAPNVVDVEAHLATQDAIYVGGGNTRRMLAVWRHYGVDRLLHELWRAGRVILAGLSAGSLCWFDQGVTDSVPGRLTPMACLGWLPGSHCPHYDGEAERRPTFEHLIGAGDLSAGIAADDGCALHYEGTHLFAAVSSRPDAYAWEVTRAGRGASTERLVPRYLGTLS